MANKDYTIEDFIAEYSGIDITNPEGTPMIGEREQQWADPTCPAQIELFGGWFGRLIDKIGRMLNIR